MEQVTLGYQIAKYRKEKGLTQEVLANKLGVTNQAVSKWESDLCCPEVQLLPKLADAFDVTLDQLFGRETPDTAVVDGLPWDNDGTLRAVLYVGTRLQKHQILDRYSREKARVEFHYSGPALNVSSDFSIVCKDCTITGNIDAGDGVTCGDVGGNVSAGDGVHCGCVNGSVDAGDSVTCGDVGGNINAGDSVKCNNVGGSVTAGDSVHCNMVKGAMQAGDSVRYHGPKE